MKESNQVGVGEGQLEHEAYSPLPFVNEHTSYGTCASAHTYWQQWSYGVGHPAVLNKRPVHVDVGNGKLAGPVVVTLLSVVLDSVVVLAVVLGAELVVVVVLGGGGGGVVVVRQLQALEMRCGVR